MRYYSKEDQTLLKLLINKDLSEKLGSFLVGKLLGVDRIALFLQKDANSFLFEPCNGDGVKFKADKTRLTSILSLLDYLEQQGYLYCLDDIDNVNLLFCSSKDPSIAIDSTNSRYTFQEGYIEAKDGQYNMYNKSRLLIMKGHSVSPLLAQKLRHYFAGEIYPAEQLRVLVESDFKPIETLQYEQQMRYARRSLHISWGAFIVSLLTMCVNVPISNSCGRSTINSNQFSIIDSIRMDVSKIRSVGIDLIHNRKDTIQNVRHRPKEVLGTPYY